MSKRNLETAGSKILKIDPEEDARLRAIAEEAERERKEEEEKEKKQQDPRMADDDLDEEACLSPIPEASCSSSLPASVSTLSPHPPRAAVAHDD